MEIHTAREMSPRRRTDPWLWGALVIVTAVISPYLVPWFSADRMYSYAEKWVDLPLIAVVVVIAFSLGRRSVTRPARGFWLALGIGFGCWLAGRILWGVFASQGLWIDLLADFCYLQVVVALLVMLELDPEREPLAGVPQQLRWLSLGGGLLLLLAGYVYFSLIPALLAPDTYRHWQPSYIGTLLFDVYLLARLGWRFRDSRAPYWRRVYGWLTAAWLLWVATDSAGLVWAFVPDSFPPFGTRVDLWWLIPLLVLIYGLLAVRRSSAATPGTRPSAGGIMLGPLGGTPLLPYAFLLPTVHAVLDYGRIGDPDLARPRGILVMAVTVILAGLIVRAHRLIISENRRLRQGYEDASQTVIRANRELEARVERRTSDLVAANELLAADIEQRKRIETTLRLTEQQRQALIHAIPDDLVLLDRHGVIRQVFQGGQEAEHLVSAADAGRCLRELLPGRIRVRFDEALVRAHDRRARVSLGLEIEGAATGRHLEFRFSPCGEEEILVLIQDLTERRALELTLRQTQKMESLGLLAGGIAHDFNNLLTSILGNAELLREARDEAEAASFLAAIENNGQRAAKLTANLLAYAGDAHIELERLDLVRIMTEMEPLLAAAVPGPTRFAFEPGTEALWIDGNEGQLIQVVLNLVRNAGEAMAGRGGLVSVSLAAAHVEAPGPLVASGNDPLAAGTYACLRVADDGSGIGPADRERIFDPFFTSKGTGRGLGLAAVRGIVAHHGAGLVLESAPDEGTAFSIYFPLRAAAAGTVDAPGGRTVGQGAGLVLVVDDEDDLRRLVSVYLRRHGYTTVEAQDGSQAVAQARLHRDHLTAICMDYSMPGMTGAEAHRHIRQWDSEVPIVIMSGYGEADALDGLNDAGRTAFLSKPFPLSRLTSLFRERFGVSARAGDA